jgi:hypothetical protein
MIFANKAFRVAMSLIPPRQSCNSIRVDRIALRRLASFLPRYTLAKNSVAYRVFLTWIRSLCSSSGGRSLILAPRRLIFLRRRESCSAA